LIYSQRDVVRVLVGYGFGRNKIVLLSQSQQPASNDVEELQVSVVVNVEVLHLTDDSTPGVENGLLAKLVVRWGRVLVVRQPG